MESWVGLNLFFEALYLGNVERFNTMKVSTNPSLQQNPKIFPNLICHIRQLILLLQRTFPLQTYKTPKLSMGVPIYLHKGGTRNSGSEDSESPTIEIKETTTTQISSRPYIIPVWSESLGQPYYLEFSRMELLSIPSALLKRGHTCSDAVINTILFWSIQSFVCIMHFCGTKEMNWFY